MVETGDGWVEIPSFAKLNLFLDVLKRRGDGYHEIEGLFQTITFHDTLKVRFVERGLRIESTRFIPGENTIERAIGIFKRETGYDFGIEVVLIKRIPMMAGFGGGSSNAGAVLRFLGERFGVPKNDLIEIASKVGSDVPFFLKGGTAIVRGRGDIVDWLDPLPNYGVVLAIPEVRIGTGKAYSCLREVDFSKAPCSAEELYEAYKSFDFDLIRRCSYNIFQEVLKDYYIEIKLTLRVLEKSGGIVTMMTGSGSGCFTVFEPGKGVFEFNDGAAIKSSKRLI